MENNARQESVEYDVVIVGGGPSGLATAIRLKQINPALSVVVLEKGCEIGAHILSGAIMDPLSIEGLLPGWSQEKNHPFKTTVQQEGLFFLTKKRAYSFPDILIPYFLRNHGSFIVSLGKVCRWLAKKAENLGVEIYSGFPAVEILFNKTGAVIGVITGDMGVGKDGTPSNNFMRGIKLFAKYTIVAEGARGSLAKKIIAHYALDKECASQKYGLGIKELWEIDPYKHHAGLVQHFLGWPLDNRTGGGSFLYHLDRNKISLGLIVHLDYKNPYLSPFEEFQRFKTHPVIRHLLSPGRRLSYGARVIAEGGLQSIPRRVFPGGVLVGCSVGFVNIARLNGTQNAILSGIEAAEYTAMAISSGRLHDEIVEIETKWHQSHIRKDLFFVRNIKPLWERYGTKFGLLLGGVDLWCQNLLRFSPFRTLSHKKDDASALEPAFYHKPILYPAADNVLTFDRLSSVFISGTHYDENQPCHLFLKDKELQEKSEYTTYGGPSTRYCPAAVYEWEDHSNGKRYVINAQNCIQCKTCDIKDPNLNIDWTSPQGGDGPVYLDM